LARKHGHGTKTDVDAFVLRRTLADDQAVKQRRGKTEPYASKKGAQPQKYRGSAGQQVHGKGCAVTAERDGQAAFFLYFFHHSGHETCAENGN